MQRGVPEQVAEVLKELQQLVRGVLEDGQHLGGHHVVNHEEGRLGDRLRERPQRGFNLRANKVQEQHFFFPESLMLTFHCGKEVTWPRRPEH